MPDRDAIFLNDPVIDTCLNEIEDYAEKLLAARYAGNYSQVSLLLGMIAGTCSKIYGRNAEIG